MCVCERERERERGARKVFGCEAMLQRGTLTKKTIKGERAMFQRFTIKLKSTYNSK